MAIIDTVRDVVVLRIVYDGPPLAGKTASVQSLARILGGDVETPEAAGGRTLWYDWMAYVGGRYEGRPILCQTVSVPGQSGLAARRRAILAGADVVVFVADTTEDGIERSLRCFADMRNAVSNIAPAVPVVVQANKRDHPRALPIDDVASRLAAVGHGGEAPVMETNGATGEGVRQAFVGAVRLALRRVSEVVAAGQLASGDPGTSAELLAMLRAVDDAAGAVAEPVPVPAPAGAAMVSGAVSPGAPGLDRLRFLAFQRLLSGAQRFDGQWHHGRGQDGRGQDGRGQDGPWQDGRGHDGRGQRGRRL